MDFKDTLNLPQTDFPMRGNLPQNEPKQYKLWDEQKIYEKMKTNREGCESFTLHDGPPYANGNIHIGHALNKVLKDIIIKYNYFDGKSIRFTPGWDCHGLPIEQKVEEALNKKKKIKTTFPWLKGAKIKILFEQTQKIFLTFLFSSGETSLERMVSCDTREIYSS